MRDFLHQRELAAMTALRQAERAGRTRAEVRIRMASQLPCSYQHLFTAAYTPQALSKRSAADRLTTQSAHSTSWAGWAM